MIRAFVLSSVCAASLGVFALAQQSDTPDFSEVDAALEALVRPADEAGEQPVFEANETVGQEGADVAAVEIDPLTGEPVEDEEEEVTPLIENTWIQSGEAVLRGLDKITGRSTDFVVKVGEPKVFGSLEMTLATCFARPPEQAPENAVFLTVNSLAPMETEAGLEEKPQIFSGWMFASSPGLNALEHPVYDVWVIGCDTSAEQAG